MKLLLVLTLILLSNSAHAKLCKGNFYTRADNGTFAMERVQYVITSNFREELTFVKNGQLFNIQYKKSDDWSYYSYVDQNDFLHTHGFRNSADDFDYSEMRFNRDSFFKFKDKAILGFNLICRL